MINELIKLLQSSIDKSVELKMFKNKDKASYAHLFSYKLEQIPLSKFKKGLVKNFKADRLKSKTEIDAYPENNRPKGIYNLEAVKFHRSLISQNVNPLIFVVYKRNKYHLIHGSHKIIAAHLDNFKKIDAFVVYA